jgi:hypothetical protein
MSINDDRRGLLSIRVELEARLRELALALALVEAAGSDAAHAASARW